MPRKNKPKKNSSHKNVKSRSKRFGKKYFGILTALFIVVLISIFLSGNLKKQARQSQLAVIPHQVKTTVTQSISPSVSPAVSLSPTPSPTPVNIPSSLANATSGWPTYPSPRGDYSIRYPSTWDINGSTTNDINLNEDVNILYSPYPPGEGRPSVTISKVINSNDLNFLDFYTNIYLGNIQDQSYKTSWDQSLNITDANIGQYTVKEVTGRVSEGGSFEVFFPMGNNSYIFIALDNNDGTGPVFNTFQDMLASFQLLK